MRWVDPNDEMPKRYITILLAIRWPKRNQPLSVSTGVYTGERWGWYADLNGKYLDTDQIQYWAPIAQLPREYE